MITLLISTCFLQIERFHFHFQLYFFFFCRQATAWPIQVKMNMAFLENELFLHELAKAKSRVYSFWRQLCIFKLKKTHQSCQTDHHCNKKKSTITMSSSTHKVLDILSDPTYQPCCGIQTQHFYKLELSSTDKNYF